MGTLLKLFLAAVLALPTGAFVAGRLSAGQTDLDRPRPPVVLEDPAVSEPQETLTSRPRSPRDDPDRPRGPRPVEVIGPRPTDLDDDLDEHDDERSDEREDRGPGPSDPVDRDETDGPVTRGEDDGDRERERDEDEAADDGERDEDEEVDEPDDDLDVGPSVEPSETDDEPDDD